MGKVYDVAIIGGGPAGITTAIYASRSGLSVALIEKGLYGGALNDTDVVENYTSFTTVGGFELAQKMEEQVKTQDNVEHIYGDVIGVDRGFDLFHLNIGKDFVKAKTVVVATGVQHKSLGIEGEKEYTGKGVSVCATCDGNFFKGKDVAVIGGGDSAVESALYLSNIVNNVYLVHRRDELKAENILQERLKDKKNISVVWNSLTNKIEGNGRKVNQIELLGKSGDYKQIVYVDGVFVNIGMIPTTSQFRNLGILDDEGYVITDKNMKTYADGVFAVGDVRKDSVRQIVSATGDGAVASESILKYFREND